MSAIEFDSLSKTFRGGVTALRDLDLTIERGEVFGFVGPNGAGKTTAIRMLLDLLRPTTGAVRVLGKDVRRSGIEIRQQIGYLPGELKLDERLTANEILRWFARLRSMPAFAQATELAERFDLPLDRPVRELSKGNKQKVGLIQAMMHQPALLILDEPTSGLDPLLQHAFVEMVQEARQSGVTAFISSHVMSELEHVVDRVGMVRDGELLAVEKVESLKQRMPHHVTVRFAYDPPAEAIAGLEGVSRVVADGNIVRFQVLGSMNGLLKLLAAHEVIELTSAEPDLEEIFMSFYGDDRGAEATGMQ